MAVGDTGSYKEGLSRANHGQAERKLGVRPLPPLLPFSPSLLALSPGHPHQKPEGQKLMLNQVNTKQDWRMKSDLGDKQGRSRPVMKQGLQCAFDSWCRGLLAGPSWGSDLSWDELDLFWLAVCRTRWGGGRWGEQLGRF